MKYNDVEFSITGIINGEVETVTYRYKDGKGTIEADEMIEFLLPALFAKPIPVGPVGQYLDRDINNPLAMLCMLKSDELFKTTPEIKLISGTMPTAAEVPNGAII